MKELRVGLIGCGFMGRAHSNAYRRLNNFFPVEHRAVLKAICATSAGKGQQFAETGATSAPRPIGANWSSRRHRPHRHLRAQQHPPRNRAGRRGSGQDGPLRKAAGHERGRGRRDGRRPSRRPASPTWSGSTTAACRPSRWPSRWSTRDASAGRSTTGPPTSRTGPSPPTCRKAATALWRLDAKAAGSGVTGDLLGPLHRHRRVAQRPDLSGSPPRPRRSSRNAMHAETGKVRAGRASTTPACSWPMFANGSMGTFESTRYARGRKNFNTFELNGEDGSVYFDLEDPQYLAVLRVRRSEDRQEGRRPPHRLAARFTSPTSSTPT